MPKAVGSEVLKNTRNIFEEMRAGKLVFTQGHYVDTTEETNAYRKARDIEEKSRTFYQEKAETAADNEAKLLLRMLAAEEDKHCRIMDNIIDFVSRPEPGNWLENAEWHHLEAY
jgi:rubrerythrin